MKYQIKMSTEMGRGIYVSPENKHAIYKGSLVCQCEILLLSAEDTVKVNQTDLKYYTFVFDSTRDCLVLGDGEIFNHSDTPNVRYDLVEFEGRTVMLFRAIRDLIRGEQLFIDYNQDTKIDVKNYIDNKSLI